MKMEIKENVNHPKHYGGDTPYEVIKVLEAWHIDDFCIGNAIKYIARAGKKDASTIIEDYKKAVWYIQHKIDILTIKKAIKNSREFVNNSKE